MIKLKNILSEIEDQTIHCEKCGWKWKLSNGGKDPYICHKCSFNNSERYLDEDCWKGYKQYGMKKKGKKLVPNCVPVEEVALEESINFENFKSIVFSFTHTPEETRFQNIQELYVSFKAIEDPAERKEAVKMLKQSGLIGYLKNAMYYSTLKN
jgi:hypothetical protein